MKKRHKIPSDVKTEVLAKIRDEGKSVKDLAEAHGISTKTIYTWLGNGANQPTLREIFVSLLLDRKSAITNADSVVSMGVFLFVAHNADLFYFLFQ